MLSERPIVTHKSTNFKYTVLTVEKHLGGPDISKEVPGSSWILEWVQGFALHCLFLLSLECM